MVPLGIIIEDLSSNEKSCPVMGETPIPRTGRILSLSQSTIKR